jgi:hypothetical protein
MIVRRKAENKRLSTGNAGNATQINSNSRVFVLPQA